MAEDERQHVNIISELKNYIFQNVWIDPIIDNTAWHDISSIVLLSIAITLPKILLYGIN